MSVIKNMIEVTAAILEKDDKIMIARRASGKHLAGYWEFPGGKIEPNEAPEICLKRELKEEFEIDIEIDKYVGESIYQYPEKMIKLLGFTGFIKSGKLTLNDHDKVEWIHIEDLNNYKMAPADLPLITQYNKKRNIR